MHRQLKFHLIPGCSLHWFQHNSHTPRLFFQQVPVSFLSPVLLLFICIWAQRKSYTNLFYQPCSLLTQGFSFQSLIKARKSWALLHPLSSVLVAASHLPLGIISWLCHSPGTARLQLNHRFQGAASQAQILFYKCRSGWVVLFFFFNVHKKTPSMSLSAKADNSDLRTKVNNSGFIA